MIDFKHVEEQIAELREFEVDRGKEMVKPALTIDAADTMQALLDENKKLKAALEGLHFHHKVFEPMCSLCVDQMMIVDPALKQRSADDE